MHSTLINSPLQKDETHFFNFLEKTLQSQESIYTYIHICTKLYCVHNLLECAVDVAKNVQATKSTGQNLNVEVTFTYINCMYISQLFIVAI